MKISKEKPPNYETILKHLDVEGQPVVFTYGDTLYNVPDGYTPQEHLLVHERIHTKQQAEIGGADIWWEKYLTNNNFRLLQELQAYAAQYKFCFDNTRRKISDGFLDKIAHDLASEAYGNIISFNEAQTQIRRLAKTIK